MNYTKLIIHSDFVKEEKKTPPFVLSLNHTIMLNPYNKPFILKYTLQLSLIKVIDNGIHLQI